MFNVIAVFLLRIEENIFKLFERTQIFSQLSMDTQDKLNHFNQICFFSHNFRVVTAWEID